MRFDVVEQMNKKVDLSCLKKTTKNAPPKNEEFATRFDEFLCAIKRDFFITWLLALTYTVIQSFVERKIYGKKVL